MSLSRGPKLSKFKKSKKRLKLTIPKKKYLRKSVSLKSKKSSKKLKTQIQTQTEAKNLQLEVAKKHQEQYTGTGGKSGKGQKREGKTGDGQKDFGNNEYMKGIEDVFQQEGLNITAIDMYDMMDDYDELRRIFGGKIPIGRIVQIYKARLNFLSKNGKIKKSKNVKKPIIDHNYERQQAINDKIFEDLEKENITLAILRDTNNITKFQYLFKKFKKLHTQQKYKLLQLLTKLLQSYKQGKIIEIYEIQISDDGTIIIKTGTSKNGENKQIISIKNIGEKNVKKVKKFLEN